MQELIDEVWQEFVKEAEEYGWYLVTPNKKQVDIRCKGKEYDHFPFKYDEFITHDDFPLRYYKRKGVLFCNTNDIDAFPIVIDCEISMERMMMIIMSALMLESHS